MGWYNVVRPCVLRLQGKLVHHVRPTTQPIIIDDELAAPLVLTGDLAAYPPVADVPTGTVLDGAETSLVHPADAAADEAKPTHAEPRVSRARRGKAPSGL